MSRFDLLRLSIKTLRTKFVVIYVLLVMLGVCSIYFAGAILHTVITEKAEPCELRVTPSDYKELSDGTIWEFLEVSGVLAATNRLDVPVKLTVGKYEAELTLVGVDSTYLDVYYNMGGVFPENSMMPWIIINKDSLKTFRDPTDTTKRASSYVPPVDWLNEDFSMSIDETALVSKVSGIYESEETADAGYMDLEIARKILQGQGRDGAYTSAVVRIRNIGAAQNVTKAIEALGYIVSNPNTELQERWDVLEKEALYLVLIGLAILIVASQQQKMEFLRQERRREALCLALQWMGMTRRMLRSMKGIQNFYICIISVSLGIMGGCLILNLIHLAQRSELVVGLAVPMTGTMICWGVCGVLALILNCINRESENVIKG